MIDVRLVGLVANPDSKGKRSTASIVAPCLLIFSIPQSTP
jgi:hypothetical protein